MQQASLPCRGLAGCAFARPRATLVCGFPARQFPALAAAIRRRHPYELPELIALPIVDGLPDYLAWVASETAGADPVPPALYQKLRLVSIQPLVTLSENPVAVEPTAHQPE